MTDKGTDSISLRSHSCQVKRLILLLGFLLPAVAFSQQILILVKVGSGKYYTYPQGEQIILKRYADTVRFSGTITSVSDSGFVLDMTDKIAFRDVKYVYRRFPHRKQQGNYLIIAGGALLGITSVNNLTHCKPVIDPLFLGISTGIASLGVLWRSLSLQRYRIGPQWKLRAMDPGFL